MKKLLSVLLAAAMLFSMAACGGGAKEPEGEKYTLSASTKFDNEGNHVDEALTFTADIYYPEGTTVESSRDWKVQFTNKESDFYAMVSLVDDSNYFSNIDGIKAKESYTEVTGGQEDYAGYTVDGGVVYKETLIFDDTYSKYNAKVLYLEVKPLPGSERTPQEVLESEEIQKMIASIKYNGVADPAAEGEGEAEE